MIMYDKNGKPVGELYDGIEKPINELYAIAGKPKKRIALCVGHNPQAQGAVGSLGISEFSYNSYIANEVVELIKNNEVKIFFREPIPSYTDQQDIMHSEIAAWGNVDYAIELHYNSSENEEVNGHEVLYLSSRGKELALKMNAIFNKYLDNHDRGVKKRSSGNGYGFLARGSYSSIITEPFFGSHQDEVDRDSLIGAYVALIDNL